MLGVAVAVRWDLGRGIFFEQKRVGLDGEPFTVRKFRSMKHLPPGATSPWSVTDDARFGRVGKFIRRFSLDELPQLFNVLKGDMSLVGPRPERPEFVDQFTMDFPRYADRHRVPVGLTGLAAVEGLRGDTSILERAYFDNLYIENWSLWLDVKILLRTVVAVLRGTGG
jgi:lipopolysaccharide/colanic/teichoic acid biosynthesis glycosyltransferase